MDEWVRVYRHELDEHGVDPDGLLAETHERAREHKGNDLKLLDSFIERVARPRERA